MIFVIFISIYFVIICVHYWNPTLCRVLGALPSAFCGALGKKVFADCRTQQSLALGNDRVYREQDSRHRNTTRQRNLCRVPNTRRMAALGKGPLAAVYS
jgi:hypothetical protein